MSKLYFRSTPELYLLCCFQQPKFGKLYHTIFFSHCLYVLYLAILSLQTIEHEHPIHKISFISHDPEDRHVFGYIYSPPRSAANDARKYYLFAIKSDKSVSLRFTKLFQTITGIQEKDCGIYCYKEYGDQSVCPQSFVDNKHKFLKNCSKRSKHLRFLGHKICWKYQNSMAVKTILKKVQKVTDFEKKITPKNLSTRAKAKAVSCTSLSAIFFESTAQAQKRHRD